jgi:hypothetical protein
MNWSPDAAITRRRSEPDWHAIKQLERGRLDAIAQGDRIRAERAAEGIDALAKPLAELNRNLQ